jgi:2-polyprenyl-6-methoxyphenol hydroxylase-like FAD-dependent oxidoreductase
MRALSAKYRNAVVIGAGMAGLQSARVLSARSEQVTIIDRDALPAQAENRRGVAQGRHLHALLTRGEQILEELLRRPLEGTRGGRRDSRGRPGRHALIPRGRDKLRFYSWMTMLSTSRPLLEADVRRRVLALPDVTCMQEHNIVRLLTSADGGRVGPIAVRPRGDTGDGDGIAAAFVVDASGRGSRAPDWLAEHVALVNPPTPGARRPSHDG